LSLRPALIPLGFPAPIFMVINIIYIIICINFNSKHINFFNPNSILNSYGGKNNIKACHSGHKSSTRDTHQSRHLMC
jgi:hypothetical protein